MEYNSCIKIPGSANNETKNAAIIQEIDNNSSLYLKMIGIANKYFGEKQWSHSVSNQTVDFTDYVNGKYTSSCSTFVKVQLKDGIFHEECSNCYAEGTEKWLTLYKAKEISATNALKKALLCFGEEIAFGINNVICNGNKKENPKLDNDFARKNPNKSSILERPLAESTPLLKPQPTNSHFPKDLNLDLISEEFSPNCLEKKNPENFFNTISKAPANVQKSSTVSSPKVLIKTPLPSKSTAEGTFEKKIYPKTPMPSKLSDVETEKKAPPRSSVPSKLPAGETAESKHVVPENLTEEEARQLRKRKQKEKQEEYRKMFVEKQRAAP